MGLVSDSIPNMINGVSQQPYSLRNKSQCEAMHNCYPSVVEGLRKRPPTRHIATVFNGALADSFIHTINRDQFERYLVVIRDGDLQVFDLDGVQKTVNFPPGKTYLNAATPSTSFRAVTVADYTFIVNTNTKVTMDSALSPDRDPEALVNVRVGDYGKTYRVVIDGVEQAATLTPDGSTASDVNSIDTSNIAADMYNQLVTNLGTTDWEITQYGRVVYLRNKLGNDFTITCDDGSNGLGMYPIKDRVQNFNDLPLRGPAGFFVKVVGTPDGTDDDYYVEYDPTGSGSWIETRAQGIPYKLDATTMPHRLVREADGTFTFDVVSWGDRVAGDEDSSPNPSFVGHAMSDAFFYKNRLGFLADANVVLSRAGSFFDYFASTVTTLLDDGPIDVAASTNQVAILRHAIPFDERLLLFSDLTQFILEGGDILTPRTVAINLTTQFESSLKAKPVGAGRNVFFSVEKGRYAGVREYYVDPNNNTNDAADVTGHIPKYIRGGITKMSASTNEDIMVCLSNQDRTTIYPYKYFWSDNEKLQSAWSEWTYNQAEVLNADFIDTTLYLLMQRESEVTLERMEVTPGHTDPEGTYLTHLDRKVTEAECTVSYNNTTNKTTFTLPYTTDSRASYQVVTREGGSSVPGVLLQGVTASGNTVTVNGDQTGASVFIGQSYLMRFQFSRQVVKEQSPGGGSNVIGAGRLQLLNWTLIFDQTGYFEARVTHTHRPEPSDYQFTGRVTGSITNQIGKVSLSTGRFKFPVLGQNTETNIEIMSDSFLPVAFQGAEWEARFVLRSQRL